MTIPSYNGIGIYAINNKTNGKSYVGVSLNVNQRLKSHLNALNKSKHDIPELQKDFNKGDVFVCEILHKFDKADDSYKQALIQEQKCIKERIGNSYNRQIANIPVGMTFKINTKKLADLFAARIDITNLSTQTISKICQVLNCRPSDIIDCLDNQQD